MARLLLFLLGVMAVATLASAGSMKMYKKVPGTKKYQQVLVAVSSTVISLDDLPSYTVSSRLGPATEVPPAGVNKPEYPTKLIIAGRKKDAVPKKAGTAEDKKEYNA